MYQPVMSEENVRRLYFLKLEKKKPMTRLLDQILNEYFEHQNNQNEAKEGGEEKCMSVKCVEIHSKSNGPTKEGVLMTPDTATVPSAGEGLIVVRLQMVKEEIEYYGTKKVRSPADVEEVVRSFIGNPDREVFLALHLSPSKKINSIHVVSIGSLNQSLVEPRECFKAALISNAEGVVFAHNHPSGEVTPSPEDKQITAKLKECGQLLNIRVLDHVIVGEKAYFSFQENGLL